MKELLPLILLLISINLSGQQHFDFIDKIQDYQQNVELDNSSDYTIIDSTTFDIGKYLGMFDKLEIETRLKPQLFYVADMFGGCPYLVAIEDTFNVSEYVKSELETIKKDKYYDPDNARGAVISELMVETENLKDFIIPINSKDGFVQYLFYSEMAECFALYWHSNYRKKLIISSTKKFKERMKPFLKSDLYSVNKKRYSSLKKQDLSPQVAFRDGKYIIIWYEILPHNGVYKRKYEIENHLPYKIEMVNEENVLQIQANYIL
ncbi:hypothetical protein J1N10_19025 [Carboxylicivirga sp. A043]|uniref:hypothetical protein n=1 Tax=Carboxylicivirga litoralis TaxID=2816963 RepID=UPI0021CB0B62|nr:hypothetical protein [Carboxylicivirga sp. A043]MCU4158076.1 hypothetical protein [Carboxylicivirga sp. A043]